MLRDLLDALRCPRDHEESWLVAMVHHADGPLLREADLACPVCGAEFPVRGGVASFTVMDRPTLHTHEPGATPTDDVGALRLAAQLGVTGGMLPILLAGRCATAGAALAEYVDVPQIWVNGAPEAAERPPLLSRVEVGERLPLGVGTLAAAAVDAAHATPALLAGLVRAVRQGGRIVAPAGTECPAGVRELARDDREWVAEVTASASGLVELRRRAPDQVG